MRITIAVAATIIAGASACHTHDHTEPCTDPHDMLDFDCRVWKTNIAEDNGWRWEEDEDDLLIVIAEEGWEITDWESYEGFWDQSRCPEFFALEGAYHFATAFAVAVPIVATLAF